MSLKIHIMGFVALFLVLGDVFGVHFSSKSRLPKTYAELILFPADKLQQVDIGLMNLLCAEGLQGAEDINIQESLTVLDQWAEMVKQNEQKYSTQYFKNPQQYENSYKKFQAVNLGLTLKDDLKCGYNQELVNSGAMEDIQSSRFFRNSEDLFLYGFIEKRSGSCSSLPVLMVAIGRRCGYPLYLVTCKGHLFCRWDDGKEVFNIETACPGIDSKPDSYYKHWPHPTNQTEAKSEKFLKSLNHIEELAVFVRLRASCLEENQRYAEASEATLSLCHHSLNRNI